MKYIKKIIILLIILIIIIIITLIWLHLKNKNEIKKQEIQNEPIEEEIVENPEDYKISEGDLPKASDNIEDVTDINKFAIVENCIQDYYKKTNENSNLYYELDYEKNRVNTVPNEEIIPIKLNLLSEEYKQKNNITENNVNNYINGITEEATAVVTQMKVLLNDPIEKYLAYGYLIKQNYEILDTFYIFVNIDTRNRAFSIEPIRQKYDNIESIQFENTNKSIEFNGDNYYEAKILNNEEISNKYFNFYKNIILADPELVYNNFLDNEYKEKRFGNIENFKNYISENREEIEQILFKQYQVDDIEDNITRYVCKDQYNNIYIFNATNPMQFSMLLDTYTILTEKFTSTYQSAALQDKVIMNIEKWIEMLNTRNYIAAYNLLDETFRKNNFGSVEQFETIMKEKLPLHYKAEYSADYTQEKDIFLQELTLENVINVQSDTVKISVIMQLKEGTDFVMSFSFTE